MHAIRVFKQWADTHHASVREGGRVHDQAFWALVALVVLGVALAALAIFVEVDPATLFPAQPYLDTYMIW